MSDNGARACGSGAEATADTVRSYVRSLPGEAATVGASVRGHWETENRRHSVLDVALRENESRSHRRSRRSGSRR